MSKIFGIEINKHTKKSFFADIERSLSSKNESPLFIVTLNPEIALLAKKDPDYAKIIQRACPVIDGFGIKLMMAIKRVKAGERITGVEICDFLFKQAQKAKKKVMVVALKDGWSKVSDIQKVISQRYPGVECSVITEEQFAEDRNIIIDPDILIVSLGAPRQEKLIAETLKRFPSIQVTIGAGGTFDYWTGNKPRAPRILRRVGMEWLWRLAIQPNRFRRIVNAVIIFPFNALIDTNGKN